MKLSRLITYKHMVDNLSVKHIYDEIETLLKRIETDLSTANFDFDNIKERITKNNESVLGTLDAIDDDLKLFRDQFTQFVDSIEQPYYARSETVYQEGLNDSADYILDRYNFKKLLYQPETLDFFIGRVKMHSSWKWPALEFRPALGEISDNLIACDPLYLVDTDPKLFRIVKERWTLEYQRRVRYYTFDENSRRMLHQLPQNQIGLAVAVDFFNFRPLQLINRYLKEIFHMLRPGGMFIFTYNNCDYPIGVDNFENSYYCYTPGRQVKAMAQEAGFRVTSSFDMENNVSWLELQKPGTRSSLRGGQTLGKIENI